MHQHVLDNNQYVTHAHPFSTSSDDPTHPGQDHTDQEFEFYDFLSLREYLPMELTIAFVSISLELKKRVNTTTISRYFSIAVQNHRGRAPPASCVI
mgnify:FL=1